jgi:hypothetical protein
MTLEQGWQKIRTLSDEELRAAYKEMLTIPIEIALGGKNMGQKTIQRRFYGWRKGTPRERLYVWFHARGITDWRVS